MTVCYNKILNQVQNDNLKPMTNNQGPMAKAGGFLTDLFFPKRCVSCGKIDTFLCPDCYQKIIFIKSPTCLGCGKLSEEGRFCKKCRPEFSLKGVMVATHFEGPVKELIHHFKYESLKDLKVLLSRFLVKRLKEGDNPQDFLIAYTPLSRARKRWRGYNQSELLAEKVAGETSLELVRDLLIKTKNTKPQIELKRKERLKNLRGTIMLNQKLTDKIPFPSCLPGLDPGSSNYLKGKRILLVDDVVTTGATLNECAKVLRESGAKEVWGLVIAKH